MLTLLTTLALFAAPTVNGAPSVRVSYADLNLSSAAGVATFDRRIANAIDAVCPAPLGKRLAEIEAVRACRAAASAQAASFRAKALAQATPITSVAVR